jgi:hypothetical protein
LLSLFNANLGEYHFFVIDTPNANTYKKYIKDILKSNSENSDEISFKINVTYYEKLEFAC